MGSVMYLVEYGKNGFNSIPYSIYWAIVTITTVVFGDISPTTPLGKFVASIIMLMGYAIIAVPTGIVNTEMALVMRKKKSTTRFVPVAAEKDMMLMPVTSNFVAKNYNTVL